MYHRRRLGGWAAALACAALLAPPCQAADTDDPRVTLSIQDEPLSVVAERLSQAAGRVVAAHRNVARRRVSLQLSDIPLTLALQLVAEVSGLTVSQVGNVYLIHRAGDAPGTEFTPLGPAETERPPADRDKVKKILLVCRHVPPSQIAGTFGRPSVVATESGLRIVHPGPAQPTLTQTYLGHQTAASPARDAALDDALLRFQRRWTEPGTAAEADHACHSALAVPPGVLAVIGSDPTSRLILVGEPEAVEQFAATVQQLDIPASRIEVRATAYLVPADRVAQLNLPWKAVDVAEQRAVTQLAVADAAGLAATLEAAAGANTFLIEPVVVGNAAPAVFGLSQAFTVTGPVDDCTGAPGTRIQDVDWVVATTDLRVTPWLTGATGEVNVSIAPAYGDLVVRLKSEQPDAGANIETAIPCVMTEATLAAGQALVLGQTAPVGDFRAPDACPLLGNLPLVGALYRTADTAPGAVAVIVVLTARPLG